MAIPAARREDDGRDPCYGASMRYRGSRGEEYFQWQNALKLIGGQVEALKFIPFVTGSDTVLDFGCGAGNTLKSLACARRIGVEINEAARGAAKANGLECYATLGEVPDGVADVVISNHALEHVPYPIAALRELRQKVTPRGIVVLYVPIDDWRSQRDVTKPDINNHLHTWTPRLWANTLAEAGFGRGACRIEVVTHAWFPKYHLLFGKLPVPVFDFMCWMWACVRRRRQLRSIIRLGD